MGLTIHYGLSLPGRPSAATVKAKVTALRQRCLDLPFQAVGESRHLPGPACDPEIQSDPSLRWFLIQAGAYVYFEYDSRGVPHMTEKFGEDGQAMKVNAARIIGFTVTPGPGCEPANVGLRLLPRTTKVPLKDGVRHVELKLSPATEGWQWSSFCKTQFAASDSGGGSVENFSAVISASWPCLITRGNLVLTWR